MTSSAPEVRYINASDAISWRKCRRRAWFDLHRPESAAPPERFDQLVMRQGMEHERSVLEDIGEYVEASDEKHTQELMKDGVPIIYQPMFRDDRQCLVAKPDFILLENEGYRAADAKLAGSIRRRAELRIQLAVYQEVLDTNLPSKALLYGGAHELIGDKDLLAANDFLADMNRLRVGERPEAHFGASRCEACPYRGNCIPDFEINGDLGQDYFVDVRTISGLESIGIDSIEQLSVANPDELPDLPYFKGKTKKKAVLHAKSLLDGQIRFVSQPDLIDGTLIHFDIETYPLAQGNAEEVYLWGFLLPPYSESEFEYIWHDGGPDNDLQAWKDFLDYVTNIRQTHPDARLVHYAQFERNVIKRNAKARNDLAHPAVKWLLDQGGLFDIRESVAESLILPITGYGLKQICKHPDMVDFQWENEESGSQWSVVRFHDYLLESSPEERSKIKDEILQYNRDDVMATEALERWLRSMVKG